MSISREMTGGMIDRFRTLPISGWVVPAGFVVASVVRSVVATAIALAVAIALGFRPQRLARRRGAGAGPGLRVRPGGVRGRGTVGLFVRSTQAAEAFSFMVIFFPYVSDGVVPRGDHAGPAARLRRAPAHDAHRGGAAARTAPGPADGERGMVVRDLAHRRGADQRPDRGRCCSDGGPSR
ncbi:hypothetical protein [Nonomuraea dietziae]|uniref:hypothetical protein n=1 Tax=Nonomuraea dietziae TaxID=65515 RepID=UPI0031E0D607